MALKYDDAVGALYQAGVDAFVAERKRLAGELKAAGDKDGAARLLKLTRPTISAWAVNQLWWREREHFEELLTTAERVRRGELDALGAHRQVLSKLWQRAAAFIEEAGHGAPDAVLRRVTTTLSALAAAGSFEPDTPGALAADREPLGFGALDGAALPEPAAKPHAAKEPTLPTKGESSKRAAGKPSADEQRERREAEQREAQRRREAERAAEAERRRKAEELARFRAERARRSAELEAAQRDVARRAERVARCEQELAAAKRELESAEAAAAAAQQKLSALVEPE